MAPILVTWFNGSSPITLFYRLPVRTKVLRKYVHGEVLIIYGCCIILGRHV
jgi:hypothetical protein